MSRVRLSLLFLLITCGSLLALSRRSNAQDEELPDRASGALPAQRESTPREPPKTDARHYSYAIGLDIGASFGSDNIKVDVESLLAGLKDGLQQAEPRYSQEILGVAMQRLSMERMEVLKQRNADFLIENREAKGVETTKSGLQYQVLARGKGESPKSTDKVRVHYQGALIDGSVFDGSIGGDPAEFKVNKVIPGWTEALQRMKVGDRWRLFIPAKLAYGERGFGEIIPPHSTLIFELELLEIL